MISAMIIIVKTKKISITIILINTIIMIISEKVLEKLFETKIINHALILYF